MSSSTGSPYLDLTLLTNPPSSDPEYRRGAAGDPGHALHRHPASPLRRPDRRRHGALPRGVRGQDPLVQPSARDQHPEPRRGAVDRLRDPRARVPRPRARARPRSARRRDDPDAARAADRDHRGARGDQVGARLDPPGRLRARRDAVAGRLAPGAAGRDPRDRDRVDPRALARDRRDGAADHDRRGHLHLLRPDDPGAVHRAADPDLQLPATSAGGVQAARGGVRSSSCS